MRKRDKLRVIYDILNIIKNHQNSIKPTPLLRYSNLSTQSYNEYFSELKEKEFVKIEKDSKGKKFITLTDKGFKYLEKYRVIVGFIDDFGL
ncbi:MAG: winged helix-turn-helix domain-containing protein [archaeon]